MIADLFSASKVTVQVTSADCSGLLTQLNQKDIRIENVVEVDELMVCFQLLRTDISKLEMLCKRRGDRVVRIRLEGSFWFITRMIQRPLLVFGVLILLLLTIYIPTRIFFVSVEGNCSIPDQQILEAAQECGIIFGASRRQVRSEQVKNSLLSSLPELQWVGVNTNGCTATIAVRERTDTAPIERISRVSSIIASRDGVVFSCTATKGNALCKTGQAVKAGEILISGYTDCGISIRAEQAEGEVFAQTNREIRAVMPAIFSQKGEVFRSEKKYSLIIGKNKINFYKGSGISDTTCDKMYAQYDLTLPGGFRLPVSLVVEQWTWFSEATATPVAEIRHDVLKRYVQTYLLEQMVSGSIVNESVSLENTDGMLCLCAEYMCLEMIGRVRNEENINYHGENN